MTWAGQGLEVIWLYKICGLDDTQMKTQWYVRTFHDLRSSEMRTIYMFCISLITSLSTAWWGCDRRWVGWRQWTPSRGDQSSPLHCWWWSSYRSQVYLAVLLCTISSLLTFSAVWLWPWLHIPDEALLGLVCLGFYDSAKFCQMPIVVMQPLLNKKVLFNFFTIEYKFLRTNY